MYKSSDCRSRIEGRIGWYDVSFNNVFVQRDIFHCPEERVGRMQLGSPGAQGLPCRLLRRLFFVYMYKPQASGASLVGFRRRLPIATVLQRMQHLWNRNVPQSFLFTASIVPKPFLWCVQRASGTYTRIPSALRKATLSSAKSKHLHNFHGSRTGSILAPKGTSLRGRMHFKGR